MTARGGMDIDGLKLQIARLCRFYGWSWHSVLQMPAGYFQDASEAMDVLRAEEKLHALDVHHTGDPRWLARRLEAIVKARQRRRVTDDEALGDWERMRKAFGGGTCSRAT
jgi:proteasome assembly chaperone (PAC2) family protein